MSKMADKDDTDETSNETKVDPTSENLTIQNDTLLNSSS